MIQSTPGRGLLLTRAVLGALGVILTIPGIVVVLSLGTGGPLDPVGSQARALNRSITQVSAALVRVQSSLDSAGATLDEAQTTAGDAAEMTDALAAAMDDLASASGVQVLGIQPFATLVPRFSELSTRATAVAGALRSTGKNLGTSRKDLDALARQVTSLATLAGRLAGGQDGGGGALILARFLLALLLAWMGATAALSFLEARRQLRPVVPRASPPLP